MKPERTTNMKSAVNFFLKNGDIVVVNQISVDFVNELKTADQKASIIKNATQYAKCTLVQERIFTEWNADKLFKKIKVGICPAIDGFPEFVRFSHEDLVNAMNDPSTRDTIVRSDVYAIAYDELHLPYAKYC